MYSSSTFCPKGSNLWRAAFRKSVAEFTFNFYLKLLLKISLCGQSLVHLMLATLYCRKIQKGAFLAMYHFASFAWTPLSYCPPAILASVTQNLVHVRVVIRTTRQDQCCEPRHPFELA